MQILILQLSAFTRHVLKMFCLKHFKLRWVPLTKKPEVQNHGVNYAFKSKADFQIYAK